MKSAVIVSTARTGLAKSFRGSLNATHGATMGGHVIKHAVQRADQDAFAAQSQARTAAAQDRGAVDDEIVPMDTVQAVKDRETGKISMQNVALTRDECNRPGTTVESLSGLNPIEGEGKFVTAGNASQPSDGASACVVIEANEAARRGLSPLGALRGLAVAGCAPDEMGIGPIFAIPKLD